jgi:hypothetical protein
MKAPAQAPARDQRLDAFRGWMQLSIFYSHAFGSFTGAWLIHAGWGLSDSSEQFVFLSGFGLGSVFVLKQVRGGFGAACRDLGLRMARLWRMHLLVFLSFGLMVTAASTWMGEPGWDFALHAPALAAIGGALTLYQPPFMGILPLFLYGMAVLPIFAWAMARHGAWALLIPATLWVLAQFTAADIPALFGTTFAFDPLGWVPLFMLGAWFGRQALLRGHAIGRHPLLVAGAVALILAGAVMHKTGFLPLAWTGKEQLAPLRLLHALACAYLVAVLIPRDVAWARSRAAAMLAVLGRNSLQVFSLGLFFSYIASTAFRHWPEAQLWTEPLLLIGGSIALWRFAVLVEARRALPSAAPRRPHMKTL